METEDILALNINHLAKMNDNYWAYYYKKLSNRDEKAEVNLSKQLRCLQRLGFLIQLRH